MHEDNAVEFEHVRVRYPGQGKDALRDISLSISAGEYVCILGGNGSGKSTLISLVNNLISPAAGGVRILGQDVSTETGALYARTRTATVFQNPDDQMVASVVEEDVAFGPENARVPSPEIRTRVDRALDAVDMRAWALADPADLSGGQKQRVAIAGALALQPDILLLDEPSAMLDTQGRAALRSIAQNAHKAGATILHITHFMEDALGATRAIVLDQGQVVFDAAPRELFSSWDRLARLGLEAPHALRLAHALNEAGAELPLTASVRELARAVAADWHVTEGPVAKAPAAAEHAAAVSIQGVDFSYASAASPRRARRRGWPKPKSASPLALANVSATAPAGGITAIIGATGSGKSTLAELICALKVPAAGRIVAAGIDTQDMGRRRELRHRVGWIAQLPERQLFAASVEEDVSFGPRNLLPEQDARELTVRALAQVGLPTDDEFLARSPFSLSGGQQRACAIAGVIATRPDIVVMDEPMAGLDPQGRERMRALMERLRDQARTIVLITHDMMDVAELADHVIALSHGRVALTGTPEDVLASPTLPKELGRPFTLEFAALLDGLGCPLERPAVTMNELVEELIFHVR